MFGKTVPDAPNDFDRMERFTGSLIATTLATYLLVVLGAMAATTGGSEPAAVGHYVVAAAVWLLVAFTTARAWLDDHDRLVKLGLTATAILYPVQALLGLFGLAGLPIAGTATHLFGGVAVFSLLLLTVIRHLDREVQTDDPIESKPLERRGTGETDAVDSGRGGPSWIPDVAWAYLELTKPRLMWLLALLALAGMSLATITGARLDGVTVVATLFGGVLAIGSAGTFNHVYERDRDSRMDRTSERPVATDAVGPWRAAGFGAALFVASMTIFLVVVNALAAALTAVAVVYYAVVYTVVLKPTTTWNTVIGGGAGALPAIIGWAAVTGTVGVPALLLAAVVFCWTPAHFYNLAIAYRDDYARADYPMLPVVKGIETTRRRILYWLGVTLLVAGALGVVADFGALYAIVSAGVGFVFLWAVATQFRTGTDLAAYRSFHASNAYLGALLGAILIETLVV